MSQEKPVLSMPKFDFSKSAIKTTEELEKLAPTRKESKFFGPGRHEVVIYTVEYTGVSPKDPNWGKITLTLAGTGEKTLKDFLMIPFATAVYDTGEKKSGYPFRRLQELVSALGMELTVENLGETMQALFTNPDVLKGLHLVVETGYRNAHLKFSREGENTSVNIVNKDGSIVTDGKNPLVFSDRDSAMAYGEQKGIAIDGFVSVIGYDKSVTPNKTLSKKVVNSKW